MPITHDIFNITQEPRIYEGIQRFEYRSYHPPDSVNINKTGDITITVKNKDTLCYPAGSYLLFEGILTKADAARLKYTDAEKITFVNDGTTDMFDSVQYKLGTSATEKISYPGQASKMFSYLTKPRGFSRAQGLNQLWCKDTGDGDASDENWGFKIRHDYVIKGPKNKGTFQFIKPLKDIFGFCDDYNKIMQGFDHTIVLTRKGDNDALFRADGVADGKITLTRLVWMMPVIVADPSELEPFNKITEEKIQSPLAFCGRSCHCITVHKSKKFSWSIGKQNAPNLPRYIILGFQTDRSDDQTKNTALFDHVKIKKPRAVINNNKYSDEDYDCSFPDNKIARVYRDAAEFSSKFYHLNELVTDPSIPLTEYRDLHPLITFDVSKYEQVSKVSEADIKITVDFEENPPENTLAYALIISECIGTYKSNGTGLSLLA